MCPSQLPPGHADLGDWYPALKGATPANPGKRFVALFIDTSIAAIIVFVGLMVAFGGSSGSSSSSESGFGVPLVFGAVVVVVQWVLNALKGQTIGKKAVRVRMVRVDTGGAPGFGRTLARCVIYGIGSLFFIAVVVGAFQIIANQATRRAWWDWAGNSAIIDLKIGRDTLPG
ncbi:MAG: RDD family protein [Micrococcales bacterium]|nr:RDD family protein [Micrococcales bacterium]